MWLLRHCYPTALPVVTTLQLVSGANSALTLNCTSTGSPATTVVWTKNGSVIPADGIYDSAQILRDGTRATYDNLIMINSPPGDLAGLYSCIVHDSLGHNSQRGTLQVKGE